MSATRVSELAKVKPSQVSTAHISARGVVSRSRTWSVLQSLTRTRSPATATRAEPTAGKLSTSCPSATDHTFTVSSRPAE